MALLSKFPAVIEPILRYPGAQQPFYTEKGYPRVATIPKFMRVDVEAEGVVITVFVAHLKSQIGGYTAERERLVQAQIVGRTVRAPLEKGRPSIVLMGDLNDDNDTQTLTTLLGRADGSWPMYQSTDSNLFAGEAWTHDHEGAREQLDHVILSKFLNDCLRGVEIQRFDDGVSDHEAGVVEIELGCE